MRRHCAAARNPRRDRTPAGVYASRSLQLHNRRREAPPMITRRRVIAGSAGALVLWTTATSADQAVVNGSAASRDSLVTLPGKKPLIRRSFRPPNLETPLADLRRPFTANDAFFVRYHLASIPETDARTWKLRVGGASAQRALEL